ncbi:hypothetical protein HZA57_06765, partial [Candidatus Poribacteria bacterium]|nr:hypothetical protein [Candidatus Poribacteria bacterium]
MTSHHRISAESLGHNSSGTDWRRFERNVEADFEALSGGNAWVDTDGVRIQLLSTNSYRINEIRLSNAMTLEHNTLGPGVIGHIARHRTINSSTYAVTDRYFHYDQVGSVAAESDANGDDVALHYQDAFGNTLASYDSGLIGGTQGGFHHNTKEEDADTGLVYMHQRWYAAELGVFGSRAPMPPDMESRFGFAEGEPVGRSDPRGEAASGGCLFAPPATANSGVCNSYGPCDTFLGYSARCVCENAGDSAWDMQVRGCLACMNARGIKSNIAHSVCYEAADEKLGGL